MAEPFLSEIRIMSFSYAPSGWGLCNGALLPISQNQALFLLLGTTFGGDGSVNFALPDLRGRTPIHVGNGHALGELGGEQAHTLSVAEFPAHTHVLGGVATNATTNNASGNVLAQSTSAYHSPASLIALSHSVTNAGGNQAHLNMQPYLTFNFCIALQGTFPSPE